MTGVKVATVEEWKQKSRMERENQTGVKEKLSEIDKKTIQRDERTEGNMIKVKVRGGEKTTMSTWEE